MRRDERGSQDFGLGDIITRESLIQHLRVATLMSSGDVGFILDTIYVSVRGLWPRRSCPLPFRRISCSLVNIGSRQRPWVTFVLSGLSSSWRISQSKDGSLRRSQEANARMVANGVFAPYNLVSEKHTDHPTSRQMILRSQLVDPLLLRSTDRVR